MKEWKEYGVEYRSTPGAFRDFLKGTIWQDIKATIEEALEMTRDGLEMAADWESTMRLQQDADCLKRFLEMPQVILEDLEVSKEKEAAGETENLDEEENWR